jgi:hypothetical protein
VCNILRIESREIDDSTESLGFSFGKARASLHGNKQSSQKSLVVPAQFPGQTVISDQQVNISGGIQKMKHLLRIFFALALLCGGSSLAHADGVDFRMTVLDPPTCEMGNTFCQEFDGADTLPSVNLSTAACNSVGINLGPDATPYGCFVLSNFSGQTIDSLTLHFLLGPLSDQDASCDSQGQSGFLSGLDVVSCTNNESTGFYDLVFGGGAGIPTGHNMIVFEQGADPADFQGGNGTVGVTPEPDSLLLFSTGVMMAGLYMSRRVWTVARKSADGTR